MMSSHNDSLASSGTSPTEVGPDFFVENHGSIFLLRPLSPAGSSCIDGHLREDRMCFGNAFVIEHRYVWAILEGIENDGLEVR